MTDILADFDRRSDEIDAKREARLRQGLLRAPSAAPEQAARANALSDRTGQPFGIVAENLDQYEQEDALRRIEDIGKRNPVVGDFMADPRRAAIARDDVGNLNKLSQAIRNTWQAGRDFGLSSVYPTWRSHMLNWESIGGGESGFRATPAPTYFEELATGFAAGWERGIGHSALAGGIDLRSDRTKRSEEIVARGLGYQSADDMRAGRRAAFAAEQERRAQAVERVSEETESQFDLIAKANEADSLWEALGLIARAPRAVGLVTSQSVGMGAPGLAVTAATGGMGRPATMAAAGGSSGWVEYGASISETLAESGVDMMDGHAVAQALRNPKLMAEAKERAAKRGLAIGAFDAVTAGLAGKLLINARRGVASAAWRTGAETGIQIAGGSAGEAAAQLVTGEEMQWGDIIVEGLAELPFSAVEARANYRSARERGQVRWINEQLDIVRRSSAGSAALSEATIAAGNAMLAKRSPEDARAFAEAAGGDGNVYLDAEAARTLFQSDWQVLVDAVGGDTALTQQLAAGDVVIPAAEYFARVAQLPNAEEISRHARLQADALSQVELDAFDFDALAAEMAGDADAAARAEPGGEPSARQRVQDDVYGQLLSTDRYSTAAAEQQAKLFAAGITRLAEMWGTDPWTLYERRMAGIRSAPGPGQADPRSTPPWAGTGRLDALLDALRSPEAPDQRRIYGPTITDFIVGRGGVTDVGGDLRSMDAHRQRIGLINQRGEDLDRAREAAAEAGYLPADSTVADLLDLIDRDLRGDPVYSPAEGDRAAQDFQRDLDDLQAAISENEQLRDMPSEQFNALTNQQIAEILFGRSFDQTRPGSFNNPLPMTEMETAPVGAWVAGPDLPGIDTRRQIQDVPLDRIDATEFDSAGELAPEKRADAARYAESMRAGEQFPNGRGSELPNGMVKLQDGHRRYAAARATGAETMRLAVSPLSLGQAANFDQDAATDFDPSGYRPEVVSWAQETYGDAIAPNGRPVWQNFVAWFGDSKVVDGEGRPLVVYHGTDSVFTEFSRTGDIGYHFGTEIAARDRAARVGGAGVLVEPVTLSQVEKDSLAALNGEIGGTPAADLYALLLRKLDSPRQNLRAQIEAMPVDEIEQVKSEYLERPDSPRFAARVESAKAGEGFRVEVNGETVSTHRTAKEANARAARLREQAAKPMALYLRIENPIRLPDLGVWPAQEIAKEAGFSKTEREQVAEAGTVDEQYAAVRAILEAKGFDGIVYRNEVEHAGADSYIAFRPEQIKSATGNRGNFAPDQASILEQRAALDFGQPAGLAFDETAYRPEVVAWARAQLGDTIAPNGNPAWQNFTAWFGDSKAVDDEGQPLTLWHGTREQFDSFDIGRVGQATGNDGFFGTGFYFTDSRDIAGAYGGGWSRDAERAAGANVMQVYLAVRNPLELTEAEPSYKRSLNKSRRALQKLEGWTDEELSMLADPEMEFISDFTSAIGGQRFREVVEQNGFDSVHVTGAFGSMNADEWVVFQPNQAKSAADNRGNFSPADPSILGQGSVAEATGTPEFRRWFGDSKVVDENGEPLVVYHGGTVEDVFDTERGASGDTQLGRGAYFGPIGVAQEWVDFRGEGQVGEYYLSLQAPFDETSSWTPPQEMLDALESRLVEMGVPPEDAREVHRPTWGTLTHLASVLAGVEGGITTWQAADRINSALREVGFDGIIADWKSGSRQYVAFNPEQIKSATNNAGTFSPTSPNVFEQSAYHGTPHDVDRFSLQRIGTGDGNQAFGWGLYFASQQEVADFYRRNTAGIARNIPATMADNALRAAGGDRGQAVRSLVRRRDALPEAARGNTQAAIDWLRRGQNHGRLYQVDIPDDGDLLDYGALLSEQPEKVRAALEPEIADLRARALEKESGWGEMAAPDRAEENITGQFIYRVLADNLGPQGASQRLLELGIPGLRYLVDSDSRDAGDGSYNYVIWDEAAISEPVRLFQSQLGDSLVAVHNLSAENLLFSDRLGGLPAPSIGITKAASPFRGFGSISLIGGRSLATPDAANPVFSADAYTQRFPEVLWPKVRSSKAEKFLDGIDASGVRDTSEVWDYLVNTPDRDRAIEAAIRSSGFMRTWIREQGDEPVPDVMRQPRPREAAIWADDPEFVSYLREMYERLQADGRNFYSLSPDSPETVELTEAAEAAIERAAQQVEGESDQAILRDAYREGSIIDGALSYQALSAIAAFFADLNRQSVNPYATQRALAEQIGERQPEFEAWVTEQISGLFDEPKIQLGRRKVPMTLENVVEAMTRQRQVAGREQTMTFSSGQVAARNARRYRTLEEIQADRDLIVSPDEQSEANEGMEAKLAAFRNSATEYFTGTNRRGEIDTWEALDMSMKSLADASKKAATASNVAAALRRNGFDGFPDSVAQAGAEALSEIRSAVTDYFEAKPQRAVGLSEFVGAAIPADSSPEVREVLDKHGIRWMEYGAGSGLTQEQAVAQLSAELDGGTGDVLFQAPMGEGFDRWSQGAPVITADEMWTYGGGEAVFEVYHGTTANFDSFDREKANPESDMGAGFYFTNNEDDVSANYAGVGPDLELKIELEAERIAGDRGLEYDDPDVLAEARARWVQNEGVTLPVYVRTMNPAVVGGPYETQLTYEESYDAETDEYGDPEGSLAELFDAMREVASNFDDLDVDAVIGEVMERGGFEGISLSEFSDVVRNSESAMYATDPDTGSLAVAEFIRQSLEEAGYDAIVDYTVDAKFGSQRRIGQSMEGMTDETVHVIAFHPTQIKSSVDNSGAFDPSDPNIYRQREGQAPRGQIEIFPDRRMAISLFEGADRSTFLHETGHFFLEVLRDIAADPNAPDQARQEMAILLDWFGIESADQIGREHHEQFARGFEKYLAEGRAPSPELQSAFSAFKAWLLSIYRNLLNLNVTLTDEVRGVMDRMLASDVEIETAQIRQGMEPLFTGAPEGEAGQIGLTEKQLADYADMLAAANEEARAEVMQKLMASHDREAKRWYREETARVRAEVEAEYAAQPVYRAARVLAGARTMHDGTPIPDDIAGMKLDKAALVALYGEPYLQRIRGMYRISGGVHPDDAASVLGFPSGDDLVTALANRGDMKARVEAETTARMRERHGDPMTDGTLPELAMDAVHNNARVKVLQRELDMLADLTDQPRMTLRAMGELARRTMAGKTPRNIRPHDHLVAERKAARQATAAAARGDYAAALLAKRQQAFNAALYREARKATDEFDKHLRYLRRVEGRRGAIGKAGHDYLEQVDALLEGLELRPVSGRAVERRQRLAEWVARQEADGRPVNVPQNLLDETGLVNIRDMPLGDLRGVVETIKQIEHLAKTKNALFLAGQQRDREAVDAEMAASVAAGHENVPERTGDPTRRDIAARALRDMDIMRLLPANIARELDGYAEGGAVFTNVIQPIRDAIYGKVVPEQTAMQEAVAAIYQKHYTSAEIANLDKPVYRPVVSDTWSKGRILSLAMNWGSDGNREAILTQARSRLTEQQVGELLGTLDARDWQFVQDLVDQVNSYWPAIAEAQRRRTGLVPEKVAAAPFTITTSDGETITVRGGYFPLKYDAERSGYGASQQEIDDFYNAIRTGKTARAATRNGHTIERVGSGGKTVNLGLDIATSHMRDVIRDVHLGDAVAYVHAVLNGQDFKAAVTDAGMAAHLDALNLWLKDVAAGEMAPRSGLEQAIRFIRRNVTASVLGFKATVALLQVTGLIQTASVIGRRNTIRGIGRLFGQSWVGPNSIWKRIRADSAYMDERLGKIPDAVRQVANARDGKFKTGHAALIRWGYAPLARMQAIADAATWLAGEALGAKMFDGDMVKARAYADDLVIRAQAPENFIDKPAIARGTLGENHRQSELVKATTMLLSYMIAKGNVAREKYQDTRFSRPTQAIKFGVDMIQLFALEGMLVAVLTNGLPDDDDDDGYYLDDWVRWITAEMFQGAVAGLPLISPLGTASRGYTPQGVIERTWGNIWRSLRILTDDEFNERDAKALVDMAGVATGIPSSQINSTADALWRVRDGEDVAPIEYLVRPEKPRD